MASTPERRFAWVLLLLVLSAAASMAQGIPKEIHGKWTIRRVLPTHTIACWSEEQAQAAVGAELQYTANQFASSVLSLENSEVVDRTVSADEFESENSGTGSNASRVSLRELGINDKQVEQITIVVPVGTTKAAGEVPGVEVLVKSPDSIIVSACNVYFEATRGWDHAEFAVLPKEALREVRARLCSRGGVPQIDGSWQPTAKDLEKLELRLTDISLLPSTRNPYDRTEGIHVANPELDRRQYLAIVSHGRRLIYINVPCITDPKSLRWRTHFLDTCDAGWGVVYDPETERFSDLQVA